MMTEGTLRWLHWLVSQQSVQIGAPDARQQAQAAWTALQEIEQAIEEES